MSLSGPLERTLDALGHQYRRQLLFELHERHRDHVLEGYEPRGYPLVTATETATVDAAPEVEPEENHVHLPKPADYGYIHWEQASGEVRRGENWAEVEPLLTLLQTHADELPSGWL